MTPTQRAAALRLIEFETLPRRLLDIACRVRVNECLFHDDEFVDDASHALKEAIDLLRELAVEPQGKPVAWGVFVDDELFKPFNCKDEAVDWFQAQYNHGSRYDYLVLPLYAAPQQRRPLTHQQLLTWWNATTGSMQERVIQYGQFVERSHGITGEPT